MLRQDVLPRLDVSVFGKRPVNFKMVAPASQLQTVITEVGSHFGQGSYGQVSPLPGE